MAIDTTHPIERLREADRIDRLVTASFATFRDLLATESDKDGKRQLFDVGPLSADGHSFDFVSAGRPFRCVVSVWGAGADRGRVDFFALDRFDQKMTARVGSTDFGVKFGDTPLRHHAEGGAWGEPLRILTQHGARELTAMYVVGVI